jgi:hypothetical protein
MMFVSTRDLPKRHRLVVSIDGMPFTGKTHFLCTAPRPTYIFNLDYGLEGVVESLEDSGVDLDGIHFEDYSLSRPPLTSSAAIDHAKEVAHAFAKSYRELLKKRDRVTIGLDTCSEFWRQFRLADLGKLAQVPPMRYVKVNGIFRDLLNEVYHTPHNLVLIHRQKDRYDSRVVESDEGPKEVSVRVPGEVERDGFKEMDGIVQVTLQAYAIHRPGKRTTMGFRVGKCRQRLSLSGKTYENDLASFMALALDVFPASTPEEWE